jgi:hypothetical protein
VIQQLVAIVFVVGLLAGCSGGSDGGDDDDDCYSEPIDCVDPAGDHYRYVIDSIAFPSTAEQAQELGLDLDGDPQGRPDNTFGYILATLYGQTVVDPQDAMDEAISTGVSITLLDLQATSLSVAQDVGVWVSLGIDPMPAACAGEADTVCGRHLSGEAEFGIDPDTPTDPVMHGHLVSGKAVGGPGRIAIDLAFGAGEPVRVELLGARIEMIVHETGVMDGKLGGGITRQSQEVIAAAALGVVTDVVERDCPNDTPPCCVEGTTGETLVDLYDDCAEGSTTCNCRVDESELRQFCGLGTCYPTPDLDLLDANGTFNPRSDDVKDSLSIGVGITAVPAVIR